MTLFIQEIEKTQVVNIKHEPLRKRGFGNFTEWSSQPNAIYIGRGNPHLNIPASKWANPFKLSDYDRSECLEKYENYIRSHNLYDHLEELLGCEMGCWCKPQDCHGDILKKLLLEKLENEVLFYIYSHFTV